MKNIKKVMEQFKYDLACLVCYLDGLSLSSSFIDRTYHSPNGGSDNEYTFSYGDKEILIEVITVHFGSPFNNDSTKRKYKLEIFINGEHHDAEVKILSSYNLTSGINEKKLDFIVSVDSYVSRKFIWYIHRLCCLFESYYKLKPLKNDDRKEVIITLSKVLENYLGQYQNGKITSEVKDYITFILNNFLLPELNFKIPSTKVDEVITKNIKKLY